MQYKANALYVKCCIILMLLVSNFSVHALESTKANNRTFDLQDYQGQIVYVDFWASWCSVCKKSFPWMSKLQKKYAGKLKVIAINLDENPEDALGFLKAVPVAFDVIFDPQAKIAKQYKLLGLPSAFIFNQQGKLVYKHSGFRKYDDVKLEKKIQALIN